MPKLKKVGYVYILANAKRTKLYIGVTSNLEKRIDEHKSSRFYGYTYKHAITDLVYFERFDFIKDAIAQEKRLKNWHSDWKWNLVKEVNPDLKELSVEAIDNNETYPETSSG